MEENVQTRHFSQGLFKYWSKTGQLQKAEISLKKISTV